MDKEEKIMYIEERIEDKEKEINELEKKMNEYEIDLDEFEDEYCDFLDELGPVKIGSLEYSASYVLREIDPTAYRCGLIDYVDGIDKADVEEYQEMEKELENMREELESLEEELEEIKEEEGGE